MSLLIVSHTLKGDEIVDRLLARRSQRLAYRDALRALVKAQSAMLERWAEGDEAVRRSLWRDLHAAGETARVVLETQGGSDRG